MQLGGIIMDQKEYSIGAIVFPSIHDDNAKVNSILEKTLDLIRSINIDYPDAKIVIYTPSVVIFKFIMDNDTSVQVKFIEDPNVFFSGILNSAHIWANADDEKEERAVEVIQERFKDIGLYNTATFI